MTERMDGQVTWSDLGLWYGKTCPEHSQATKGETSRQSSKRSSASQSRKPPILKCLKKAGTPGGATTMKWEDDGAWLGECMTRNTGESPNAAVVSRLSQILEATPQAKYSLSAKACQGILRRAERRGKAYPTQYFYDWHHRLTGSCDMGRKQFARDHGVDLEHGMMTLTEFLELTKDAYGGDVIRKVISKMQEVE